jgi:hypothetical protein
MAIPFGEGIAGRRHIHFDLDQEKAVLKAWWQSMLCAELI